MTPQERLSNRELQVIHLRYGVGDPTVGEALQADVYLEDFSPEQIEELEAQALRKLRHLTLDSFKFLRQAV